MQQSVFHYDPSKDRLADLGLVVCSLLMGLISLSHTRSNYLESGIISWFFLVGSIWLFSFAILWLLKIAGIGSYARKWTQVHLSLDEEGLTYSRGGFMSLRRWSWTELSDIEYQRPGLLRRSSILFRPEAPRLVDRMTMEITDSGRRMRLRDIFDAAPKEIVAKLDEYRDHALANSPSPQSDGPSPEGRAGAKGDANADDRL